MIEKYEALFKESETDGEIIIPIVCVGTKEFKKTNDCRLGQKKCRECESLVWTGMGYVQPMPEPMED